jgi:hypothetical protein
LRFTDHVNRAQFVNPIIIKLNVMDAGKMRRIV